MLRYPRGVSVDTLDVTFERALGVVLQLKSVPLCLPCVVGSMRVPEDPENPWVLQMMDMELTLGIVP